MIEEKKVKGQGAGQGAAEWKRTCLPGARPEDGEKGFEGLGARGCDFR